MINEKLLRSIEEVLNPRGFTLGPLNAEPGMLLKEGVSYVRVEGELVSVTPLKICVVSLHPREIGMLPFSGNAVLLEAELLDRMDQIQGEKMGVIVDGFRLSSCRANLTQKMAQSEWWWSVWREDQSTLVVHPHQQLTDLLALLADSQESYHRPFQERVTLPRMLAALFEVEDTAGEPQGYDIGKSVWHLCGQKVFLRLRGQFQASYGVLFLELGTLQTSWYGLDGTVLQRCPSCGEELSTERIRLSPPW